MESAREKFESRAIEKIFIADLDALDEPPPRGILSPAERDRAARFVRGEDRRRYAKSHALLRLVLASELGVAPSELGLAADRFGKPELRGRPVPVGFSLSHSGRMALVAVAPRAVGIDIEEIRAHVEIDAVIERYFTPGEAAELRALPPEARIPAFYRCWTFKEAYLKALGKGLWDGLDAIETLPGRDEMRKERWVIRSIPAPEGYAAAIATEGDARPARHSVDSLVPLILSPIL